MVVVYDGAAVVTGVATRLWATRVVGVAAAGVTVAALEVVVERVLALLPDRVVDCSGGIYGDRFEGTLG